MTDEIKSPANEYRDMLIEELVHLHYTGENYLGMTFEESIALMETEFLRIRK